MDAEALFGWIVSDTTIRAWREEWTRAGLFDNLIEHALAAYDRIIGLDLNEVAVDLALLFGTPVGVDGHKPLDTQANKC